MFNLTIFLVSVIVLCYLTTFNALLLEGYDGKNDEMKRINDIKFHVWKKVNFIIKGILRGLMEAFCTHNVRLPDVIGK